ncbi:MAG: hypothetical protein HYU60_07490 [Magnetospirillum sp.]|nr:hypothetical protein [Magnetospirillum sp.]
MRIVLAILAVFFAGDAVAQTIDAPKEYRNCFILARQRPEEGWEQALAWQSLGGGEPARHCGAVALIALGKHEEAAQRLEALAAESRRQEAVRAEMLGQAGQAWLLAGKPERALAAQETALHLVPGNLDLLLDKSVTLAQVHHYKDAVAVLTDVLKRQPNRVEAMTLRASAHRYLDYGRPRSGWDARRFRPRRGRPDRRAAGLAEGAGAVPARLPRRRVGQEEHRTDGREEVALSPSSPSGEGFTPRRTGPSVGASWCRPGPRRP